MARRSVRLTDAQWAKIEPHLPRPRRSRAGGRPRVSQSRRRRRHSLGPQDGRALARPARGISQRVDLLAATPAMGRGRHVAAAVARVPRPARRARPAVVGEHVHRRLIRVGEKRGSDVGKTKRGKGSKWMVVVDGQGVPVGIHVTSASPAEVTLVDATLKTIRVRRGRPPVVSPTRLIADRAYDSDALRERLGAARHHGHRAVSRQPRRTASIEDRRHLRRYRRRWVIERTFAWFGELPAFAGSSRATHVDVPVVTLFRRSANRPAEVLKPVLEISD